MIPSVRCIGKHETANSDYVQTLPPAGKAGEGIFCARVCHSSKIITYK